MILSNKSVSIQIWHFGSKYQRIGASVKASHKQLKVVLVSGVRNFGPGFITLKFVEFPLFDAFFLDLAKFWDLDIFPLFNFPDLDNFPDLNNFPDFLACFILFSQTLNLLALPLLLFFLEIDLLLLFLLKADLLLLLLLEAGLSGDLVVFNIEVSRAIILLKPWMNQW